MIPVFLEFSKDTESGDDIAQRLLELCDRGAGDCLLLAGKGGAGDMIAAEKPTRARLLLLAKLPASLFLDVPFAPPFARRPETDVVKAWMVAAVVTLEKNGRQLRQLQKWPSLCLDFAVVCAPFSALVMSALCDRGKVLAQPPAAIRVFAPLAKSPRRDIRASIAQLMGVLTGSEARTTLMSLAGDGDPLVRAQVLQALLGLPDGFDVSPFRADPSTHVAAVLSGAEDEGLWRESSDRSQCHVYRSA
jgi:hypothetical protein